MRTYVTFGQVHTHSINGITFDKDCVALIRGDRKTAFEIFKGKFAFTYNENQLGKIGLDFYPRGVIGVGNWIK